MGLSHLKLFLNSKTFNQCISMFKLSTYRFAFLIIVYITISANLSSQNNDSLAISIRTRPTKSAVSIRWATNKSILWEQTNGCGFMVERYTIKQNGKLLNKAMKTVLNTAPIKAKPLEGWEPIVKNNSYAAIIAQALYGTEFEVTAMKTGLTNVATQLRQQEQRFLLSMYAADLSFEAAEFAGWAFTDSTALKNEYYLYRIVPADEKLAKKVQSIGSYTSLDMYEELPKPQNLNGTWGDKVVSLMWDCSLLSQTYIAYQIEKSDDGKSFRQMSNVPMMNMSDSKNMLHADSLQSNDKSYYYRIAGVTAFGETGPYSEIISGKGRPTNTNFPAITSAKVNEKAEVEIEWKFDEKSNGLIKEFELLRADADGGIYKTVDANIPPTARKVIYTNPAPTNYFVIAAIPLNGKPLSSFSVLVQPIDSTAPAAPRGLTYKTDTTGVVVVNWEANTEKDLNGYCIYRSLTKEGEYNKLTDKLIKGISYTDTLNLRSLNKTAYYRLGAVDFRFNKSVFSNILEVKLPDVIPPTSPIITKFSASEQGNTISWIKGSDTDVIKIRIYRAVGADSTILLTEILDLKQSSYTDKELQFGAKYKYSVAAVDEAGLQSKLSAAVTIKSILAGEITISSFNAERIANTNIVQLNWKVKTNKELNEILVYKKENDNKMTIWKTLPNNASETTDSQVKVGSKYEYLLEIIPKSGKSIYSRLTNVIF